MILYKPVPLLEAGFFLANRAAGVSAKEFFGERMAAMQSADGRAKRYADILIELESRLESSIETDEGTLLMLFKVFSNDTDRNVPSSNFAANLIVQDISYYFDYENCFNNLRGTKDMVRNSVANWISGSIDFSGEGSIGADVFFNIVKDCGLSSDAKMLCMDIAFNYDNYVDMLESALRPVANEFCRCGELIAPLLELFSKDYPEETNEAEVLAEARRNAETSPDTIILYPLITYYQHRIVNFTNKDGQCCAEGGIGVMHKFLCENYASNICDKDKLSTIMNVLGGKNRFNIVAQLADGPVYGRELARMLGVAPATVSQHMAMLMGAELVKLENEGPRVYYSLNLDGMRQFIDMQKRLFLKEQ